MAKKDLTGAINRGVDRLFSANDVQEAQEAQQPRKAQDIPQAEMAQTIAAMQENIEAAEARKTQGRKGLHMQRLNISLTPSAYDYVKIMSGITGKSQTQFINDLIDAEQTRNAEAYQKAKEIINNAR